MSLAPSVDVPRRYVNALAQQRLDRARCDNAGLRIGFLEHGARGAVTITSRRDLAAGPACHQSHDRSDDETLTPVYDQPFSCPDA